MIELSNYYLKRDLNPEDFVRKETGTSKKSSKYEEFTAGNLEDAITKIMKLIANLATEEEAAPRDLQKLSKEPLLKVFFDNLMEAV